MRGFFNPASYAEMNDVEDENIKEFRSLPRPFGASPRKPRILASLRFAAIPVSCFAPVPTNAPSVASHGLLGAHKQYSAPVVVKVFTDRIITWYRQVQCRKVLIPTFEFQHA